MAEAAPTKAAAVAKNFIVIDGGFVKAKDWSRKVGL